MPASLVHSTRALNETPRVGWPAREYPGPTRHDSLLWRFRLKQTNCALIRRGFDSASRTLASTRQPIIVVLPRILLICPVAARGRALSFPPPQTKSLTFRAAQPPRLYHPDLEHVEATRHFRPCLVARDAWPLSIDLANHETSLVYQCRIGTKGPPLSHALVAGSLNSPKAQVGTLRIGHLAQDTDDHPPSECFAALANSLNNPIQRPWCRFSKRSASSRENGAHDPTGPDTVLVLLVRTAPAVRRCGSALTEAKHCHRAR